MQFLERDEARHGRNGPLIGRSAPVGAAIRAAAGHVISDERGWVAVSADCPSCGAAADGLCKSCGEAA